MEIKYFGFHTCFDLDVSCLGIHPAGSKSSQVILVNYRLHSYVVEEDFIGAIKEEPIDREVKIDGADQATTNTNQL